MIERRRTEKKESKRERKKMRKERISENRTERRWRECERECVCVYVRVCERERVGKEKCRLAKGETEELNRKLETKISKISIH